MARSEFGQFLMSRRARLTPVDVGLPTSGRRRTPGLRREEVAALAGVSVDYLTRLEQGRDTNPSVEILAALATALRLDDADRNHFGWLALTTDGGCAQAPPARSELPHSVRTILDSVDPLPAFVVGRHQNLVGWNDAWAKFAEPLGFLDPEARHNLAWFTFAAPRARDVWREWSNVADAYAARLRSAAAFAPNDAALQAVVAELQQFPEFARRWDEHHVDPKPSGVVQIAHPLRGHIDVDYETMDTAGLSMIVWVTQRRADRANGLRLVENRVANQ